MKKLILGMVCFGVLAAAADLKFGTVNMLHLVKLHPSYESNRALLKSTDRDYKAKLDRQQDELKAIADSGKKAQEDLTSPMLSASAKASAQKKLEEVQRKYVAARQELDAAVRRYQSELSDLESRLMKLQTEDIRTKIQSFAREHGFDVIADSTMLAFSTDALDVTDDILKAMNIDPAKRKTLTDKAEKDTNEKK